MFAALRKKGEENESVLASYEGMLSHGNAFELSRNLVDSPDMSGLV